MNDNWLLKRVEIGEIAARMPSPVDADAATIVTGILQDVRKRGKDALYEYAVKFGDVQKDEKLVIPREELKAACERISADDLSLLKRTKERIEIFAKAQRNALKEMSIAIPGGKAGHDISPVERAGCYAPGGRFPLPSSVLMTGVTAKVAGVKRISVASPKPVDLTLAAAYLAGAEHLVSAGGAQMIAAWAYGAGEVSPVDVIVGPGNKYVTAAKQQVVGNVAIDMLAGPSELVVLADSSADPQVVAADLLSQAEHDVVAVPILVTNDEKLLSEVNIALMEQLEELVTRETASASLANGFAVVVGDINEGIAICDKLAPEHLEVMTGNPDIDAKKCNNYGGLFVGTGAAEVLGDYGAGPNHTLPTGGTARYTGGLSVFDFLRIRTWMRIDRPNAARELVADAVHLARLEGLDAHMKSAIKREH